METSHIVLLVVSSAVSFALGRTFVYFRNKKRKKLKEQLDARAAQALREQPAALESRNKSKRKRQMQHESRASRR